MSNDNISSPSLPVFPDSSPSLPTRRGPGRPKGSRNGATLNKPEERKQSLYFPGDMLQGMKEEAARLDRSLSWVVQRAWKIAKAELAQLPSVSDAD